MKFQAIYKKSVKHRISKSKQTNNNKIKKCETRFNCKQLSSNVIVFAYYLDPIYKNIY